MGKGGKVGGKGGKGGGSGPSDPASVDDREGRIRTRDEGQGPGDPFRDILSQDDVEFPGGTSLGLVVRRGWGCA